MSPARLLLATAVPLALATPSLAFDGVVASIKPVHSLVAGVMEGVGEPSLLVEGSGSPHAYSLRPSQARKLEEAKLVFWVGEGLETFLPDALQSLASDAQTVALKETAGLKLLDYREGGIFKEHDDEEKEHEREHAGERHDPQETGSDEHHHHAQGDDHSGHEHGGHDMHIWLDPDNASVMIDMIASTLSAEDPANASAYAENAAAMRARLAELDESIATTLEPVSDRPFLVFHDGYQYFEKHFGLEAAGAITVSPEADPGAARIAEMQEKVRELGATCVFSEPQFEPRIVEVVAEGSDARSGVLDPLGSDIETGPDLYFTLMQNLARSFASCLGSD